MGTDPPPSSGGETQEDFYQEGEIAAAFTGDPTFGAFAVHENGERIVAITETSGGSVQRVTGALWLGSDDEALVVFLGPDGLPEKAFLGDVILLFGNYSNDSVDLSIILPDGSVELAEGVPVDPAMLDDLRSADPIFSSKLASVRRVAGGMTLADTLRGAALAASIAGCLGGAVLAPATAGLSAILASGACASVLINSVNYLMPGDHPLLAMTGGMLGVTGCVLGNPFSCVSTILNIAANELDAAAELEAESAQAVMEGEALLSRSTPPGEVSRAPWDYDYSNTNDFVEAVRQALITENLDWFTDLLYSPIYLHGITGPGGAIGIVEQSPQAVLDLLGGVMDEFDLSTVSVTVAMSDVSSFSVPPRLADHTIFVPVHYGLRLGFDFIGGRYAITDVWLEVQ